MVIKVGKEFLKKMCRIVLVDLEVPKKDFNWYIEQFEDFYISEDMELQLGDGDKGYFADGISELCIDGYDEFSVEVVDGKEVELVSDLCEEDGEELEDCFYDFVYDAMEKYLEDSRE